MYVSSLSLLQLSLLFVQEEGRVMLVDLPVILEPPTESFNMNETCGMKYLIYFKMLLRLAHAVFLRWRQRSVGLGGGQLHLLMLIHHLIRSS